jgi:electron transport complex protein RnfB
VNDSIAARLDALLPQTQCTRCGYPTCRDYADAMAQGTSDIDRCPPGGAEGVAALAHLLGREPKPLDAAIGIETPPVVAFIEEDICIGCTKCIQACPVDAIVGAAKRMHTIVAAECTGCELCIPPCPVDCIVIVPIADRPHARDQVLERAVLARARFDARNVRLARERAERDRRRLVASSAGGKANAAPITRSAVLEAIARGKARRQSLKDTPRR